MGVLEWLGIRKRPETTAPLEVKQEQPKAPEKPTEWKLPREDIRFLSDSEKINLILQGTYSLYDELKPVAEDGSRISRLQLILEQFSSTERAAVKRLLSDLDIDEQILRALERPMAIEEISPIIQKSYGYTAARLRSLKNAGRVNRVRELATNKYKYVKMVDGSPLPPSQQKLETQE